MQDGNDHNELGNTSSEWKRKEVGLQLMALPGVSGIETASYLNALPLEIVGYETGILIQPKTGTLTQANDTFWQFLYFTACNTCIHLNDDQSVTHHFYYLQPDRFVDRLLYVERGGNVICYGCTVRYPDLTVLELSNHWHYNHGDIQIHNVKLDNGGDGVCLIKLGPQNGTIPRAITMTGSVGNDISFHASGPVQGVQPSDKIFLRFVGEPTRANLLNDMSTVDADGNYREHRLRMKFGAVGSDITTGDGKDMVRIPAELNGWRLNDVNASLAVASSSGEPAFQLRRKRAGSSVDMLSTPVTFDVNETDADDDESSQRVINQDNDDVATKDQIYLDCDAAGTGAQLAEVELVFRRY